MSRMLRLWIWFQAYTARKALADAGAIVLIVIAALFFHMQLLATFGLNSAWTAPVWSKWIAPQLPWEIALAGDAVRFASQTALKGQAATVNATEAAKATARNLRQVQSFRELFSGKWASLGDQGRSPLVESWTRLLLLGEAWLLKIQLSLLLRLPFFVRRLLRRREDKGDQFLPG